MSSPVRSDNSDAGRGRGRLETYPPRVGRRVSEALLRENWSTDGKVFSVRHHSSPVGLRTEKRSASLLKKPGYRLAIGNRTGRGDYSPWPASYKGSDDGMSCESGSGTSRSGRAEDELSTPRWTRRKHRKGFEDVTIPTRQQRLVSFMFGLVVVLASVQIATLIFHPPTEAKHAGPSANGNVAVSGASVGSAEGNFLRRADGLRQTFFHAGGVAGRGNGVSTDGAGGGGRNNRMAQSQGLSLASPRAFEMVAADMGHLKDTVEKLDLTFRQSMTQHGKDLAMVMDQLGLKSTGTGNLSAKAGRHSDELAAQMAPETLSGSGEGALRGDQHSKAYDSASKPAGFLGVASKKGDETHGHAPSAGATSPDDSKRSAALGADVWNAYLHGRWVNGQWVPKVLSDDTAANATSLVSHQRRMLLMSERRSGGGAVGGVLNADPRIFYVADPCRMGGGPEALAGDACALAVSRLLACQPTVNDVRNLYSFSYIVDRSRALAESENLRLEGQGTPMERDERVRTSIARECRRSKVVVIKETRLAEVPRRISAAELGTEFLHVVRDPRAVIHGMARSWESSTNPQDRATSKNCTEVASKLCSLTTRKLEDLNELGKERFRVLKYESVMKAPFAMMKSIFSWLQLGDVPDEVAEAIMYLSSLGAVSPPPHVMGWEGSKTTLARFEWATRWAVKLPAFRRQQIQQACSPLLMNLGYNELPRSGNHGPLDAAVPSAASDDDADTLGAEPIDGHGATDGNDGNESLLSRSAGDAPNGGRRSDAANEAVARR